MAEAPGPCPSPGCLPAAPAGEKKDHTTLRKGGLVPADNPGMCLTVFLLKVIKLNWSLISAFSDPPSSLPVPVSSVLLCPCGRQWPPGVLVQCSQLESYGLGCSLPLFCLRERREAWLLLNHSRVFMRTHRSSKSVSVPLALEWCRVSLSLPRGPAAANAALEGVTVFTWGAL